MCATARAKRGQRMTLTEQELTEKAKDIRLFAFDLDGTLMRDDKSVSERTQNAIRELLARGIEAVPATGRAWQGLPMPEIGMDDFHYLVAACGAIIRDLRTGEFFYRKTIDAGTAADLLRTFMKPGISAYVCIDDEPGTRYGCAVNREEFDRVATTFTPRNGYDGAADIADRVERLGKGVLKVGINFIDPWREEDFLSLPANSGLTVNPAAVNNIEWDAFGVSKARGLEELAHHLGFGLEQVCTIGDSGNDVEMLEAAGLGIAMGNASDVARDAADFTLDLTNEQDGLADFVERFLLGK